MTCKTKFLLLIAFSGCLMGLYLAGAGNYPIKMALSSKVISETPLPK